MSASPPPPCLEAVTDDYKWAADTSRAADILWAIMGLVIVSAALYLLYGTEEHVKFTFKGRGLHWAAVTAEAFLVGIYLAVWSRTLPCFFVDCHVGDDQVAGAILFIAIWPNVILILLFIHGFTKFTPLWVSNYTNQKMGEPLAGATVVETYAGRAYRIR